MNDARDNRTTELLREGLTEHGVEYRTTEVHGMPVTLYESGGRTWSVTDHPNGYLVASCVNLTPEQAIAATLGSEREKALEKLVQKALDEGYIDEWWYEDARKLGLEANY